MNAARARSSASRRTRISSSERARSPISSCLRSTIGSRERAARDAVGGGPQAREPARERLGGQRAGEQRDGEGQRAADHEPPLDGRDLLLDVAQRRLDEHDAVHALVET